MSIDDSDAALRIVEAGRRRVLDRMRAAFDHQLQAAPELGAVDSVVLDRLVSEASDRAGASLWRIALAEGAADEFGITVGDALGHPAVTAAEQLVGAPEEPVAVPADAGFPVPDAAEAHAPAPAPPMPMPAPVAPPAPPVAEPAAPVAEPAAPVAEPAAPVAEPAPTGPEPDAVRIAAIHTSGIETLKPGEKDIELRLSDAGLDVIKRSSGVAIGRLDWSEVTEVGLEQAKRGLRGRRRSPTLQVRTARGQARFDLPGLGEQEAAAHLEPMLARVRAAGELGAGAG